MIRVPRKESQTIHPTQQLSGWALSKITEGAPRETTDNRKLVDLYIKVRSGPLAPG